MSQISPQLRSLEGGRLAFWCPGCNEAHQIAIGEGPGPRWGYNGNPERPTFTPSVLVTSGHYCGRHKPGDDCWCTFNAEEIAEGREPTGFKCGRFTYVWRRGENSARIYAISGPKAGSMKSDYDAVAVNHPGFVSMAVILPGAMWTHGLHIQDEVVFITRQLINNSGMPTVSSFAAKCSITER
ncbi:DUF6527 family protein [Curvibacter sp. HBC28]|uniref:DUF6527 family protein n=1 Tax=Curvibacter microcysteis TaxID=3026419 RepID=A0ABT5MCJ5_9BURK|nr:DUF6527 family protein [Curvibacter sp. HBC28]MDD0814299.1 DUF6527 family protein [Curvibacter sp. HBC28]